MGKQGLLIKGTEGRWIRRGVIINSDITRSALPSPYKASDFKDITDKFGGDFFIVPFLSAVLFLILYTKGRRELLSNHKHSVDLPEKLDQLMKITVLASIIILFSSWMLLIFWGYWIIPIFGISILLIMLLTGYVLYKWAEKKNQIIAINTTD
jgi:hypothetical protein